jgi:hypothetical protein
MQNEQNAVNWFMHMVETQKFDPLNPDMSLVPNNILSQLYVKDWQEGEIFHTQAALSIAHFLFIACKMAIQVRKGWKKPRPFTVKASEIISAQERFVLLVMLEILKRDGFIQYHTEGAWLDKNAGVAIRNLHPCPEVFSLPQVPNKSFTFH